MLIFVLPYFTSFHSHVAVYLIFHWLNEKKCLSFAYRAPASSPKRLTPVIFQHPAFWCTFARAGASVCSRRLWCWNISTVWCGIDTMWMPDRSRLWRRTRECCINHLFNDMEFLYWVTSLVLSRLLWFGNREWPLWMQIPIMHNVYIYSFYFRNEWQFEHANYFHLFFIYFSNNVFSGLFIVDVGFFHKFLVCNF